MVKRVHHVPVGEHADHAFTALERAIDGADEWIKPYRTPVLDLMREARYQKTRADDLERRVMKAERALERAVSQSWGAPA